MYEVLSVWETMDVDGEPEVVRDFAGIWRGSDKVVYSRTLEPWPPPAPAWRASSTPRRCAA